MSNILKVFIVLNFVLAVVFVATAATLLGKADNWKEKCETVDREKSATIADLEKKASVLTATVAEKESAKVAAVEEKNQKEVELTAVSNQLTEQKRSNEKLGNSVNELKEQMKTLTAALKQAQTDREAYERRMTTAEESARNAVSAKETAEDDNRRKDVQVAQLQEELAQRERDLTEVRADLATKDNMVKIAMEAGVDFSNMLKAPPIEAMVQKVNPELRFVMLSVGRDDKVTKGMRFYISRGSSYVGEVQVDYVYPKSCAASFVRLSPGMEISAGDTATTRL